MIECGICLDSITEGSYKILSCNHRFHTECLKKLVKMNCPYCRKKINIKEVFNLKHPVCLGNHYQDGVIFNYSPMVSGGFCRFCGGLPL